MLVFLDANVLFSAALGGEAFEILWELARAHKVDLCTSPHCLAEAEVNILRKRASALDAYRERLLQVRLVADVDASSQVITALPAKDAPVLAAATAAGADALLTGDLRHFGALMERGDMRPRVRTVRAFLLEGPRRPPRARRRLRRGGKLDSRRGLRAPGGDER